MSSAFDIFKVGIGPSSSHTVGPMRAVAVLLDDLAGVPAEPTALTLDDVSHLTVDLLGSLGATGKGHGTDKAIVAACSGAHPDTVDPSEVASLWDDARHTHRLVLRRGTREHVLEDFDPARDIRFLPRERAAYHPNALRLTVTAKDGRTLTRTFYSVGGGTIVAEDGAGNPVPLRADDASTLPYPFTTGAELLATCAASGLSVAELARRNEISRGRTAAEVHAGLLGLWDAMRDCIDAGCRTEGLLPGPLRVRRRAAALLRTLKHAGTSDPWTALDWVSLWALAVNEQNAAGGRVVTAPTNGAAGVIPAVLRYAMDRLPGSDDGTAVDFLLAASAIGSIYTSTASISGAEVGCQGEIGVASSMAAAGLAQVLGGSPQQVVNAAEIGMEHHLGLTCDPVGGLVQIPCIERNAIAATTAITAARLALAGDGRQIVSLDEVIATMMATGADMATRYKETAEGGLAVNLVSC
ncbi:MAG: L-serine ammonia-lyase [Actinomycetia bacterium]|nr:L-serine ammonia-lyase [Actinomycetes bacterium]